MGRTPHGHGSPREIEADLDASGFRERSLVQRDDTSRARSPELPAIAFCQGTPLRSEIEARDPGGLDRATAAAEAALRARYGGGPIEGRISAVVVAARKPAPALRAGPRFVVLYRWRLHPGAEAAFVAAWSRVSDLLLRERGSLGSRLHRGADGLWYSYAQWPSAEARASAFAAGPVDPEASARMRAAIAETLPEVVLESVADFIVPPRDPSD
jgi:heme-degrading monooxygenase HmoA